MNHQHTQFQLRLFRFIHISHRRWNFILHHRRIGVDYLPTQQHIFQYVLRSPCAAQQWVLEREKSVARASEFCAMCHRSHLETDFSNYVAQVLFGRIHCLNFQRKFRPIEFDASNAINQWIFPIHWPYWSFACKFIGSLRLNVYAAHFEHFSLMRCLHRCNQRYHFTLEYMMVRCPGRRQWIFEICFGGFAKFSAHLVRLNRWPMMKFCHQSRAIIYAQHWNCSIAKSEHFLRNLFIDFRLPKTPLVFKPW